MNKREYLVELEKALRAAHVQDSAEILGEYAEHFDRKLRDGYGEEEIAARLASPEEIAGQFASIKPKSGAEYGSRIIFSAGLAFADLCAGAFFLMLYAWVMALGVLAVASAGLGFVVVAGVSLWGIIPQMPFVCALFAGLTLFALAGLSAIGTEYCRLYVTQLLRVYLRWRKTVLGGGACVSPPLTMYPQIEPKKRRIMRSVVLCSLVVCAVCCIAWYASMVIATGALEPWHAMRWFE